MRTGSLADRAGLQRFVVVLAVAVGVTGMAVAANYSSDTLGAGEARLEVDGRAKVVRAGGGVEVVSGSTILARGDEVTATRGVIRLALRDGAELEGRSASRAQAQPTEVRVGAAPELLAGSLLAVTAATVEIVSAGNRLRLEPGPDGSAAVRIERSLALAAAAYRGTIELDSAGQMRTIPTLRELEVAVLGSPQNLRALVYDESDPWDQRFLGEAIELGRRLDALSGAYSGSLAAGDGTTAAFYRQVLPALAAEVAFTDALLEPNRAPGETLIGVAIAQRGRRGTFAQRFREVFEFRTQGARWGLVALDQGAAADALIGDVESALNATPFEFAGAAPAAPELAPPAPEPDAGAASADDGNDQPDPGPLAPTVPEPDTTGPPPTLLPEIPPLLPLPPLVEPAPDGDNDLVSDVLSPLLETLTTPVNTLLGGLLNG